MREVAETRRDAPEDASLVSGASSEPSLPPNKSSGDIGERTWTPEQFWEFAAAFLGDHEATTSRTMIEDRGLVLIPAAEIERLRREVENLQRALLFWMPGVDLRLDEATRELAAKDAALLAGYTGPTDGPCWGDGMLDRAISAEFAAAKGRGEPKPYGYVVPYFGTHLFFLPKEKDVAGFYGRAGAEVVTVYAADKIEQERPRLRAAVSKKTAESGHSPSTHNSESE